MVSGAFIILTLSAVAGVVVGYPGELVERQGRSGGGGGGGGATTNYYSSSWNDGTAKVNYKNGAGGQYSVTWSGNKGNFVVGKGWNSGGAR